MKVLSKLTALLLFGALLFGSVQTAWAFDKPGNFRPSPIPIPIPTLRGNWRADLTPSPCTDSTLLMNETAYFAWGIDGKNFVIKDAKGKTVFEQAVGDDKELKILPSKLNLKPGQQYSWGLDNNMRYTFTILPEKLEQELLTYLAEFDAENISAEERTIKKAGYIQALSETYPEQFDLYWLSAKWIIEISPTDKPSPTDRKINDDKKILLARCIDHLNAKVK